MINLKTLLAIILLYLSSNCGAMETAGPDTSTRGFEGRSHLFPSARSGAIGDAVISSKRLRPGFRARPARGSRPGS